LTEKVVGSNSLCWKFTPNYEKKNPKKCYNLLPSFLLNRSPFHVRSMNRISFCQKPNLPKILLKKFWAKISIHEIKSGKVPTKYWKNAKIARISHFHVYLTGLISKVDLQIEYNFVENFTFCNFSCYDFIHLIESQKI